MTLFLTSQTVSLYVARTSLRTRGKGCVPISTRTLKVNMGTTATEGNGGGSVFGSTCSNCRMCRGVPQPPPSLVPPSEERSEVRMGNARKAATPSKPRPRKRRDDPPGPTGRKGGDTVSCAGNVSREECGLRHESHTRSGVCSYPTIPNILPGEHVPQTTIPHFRQWWRRRYHVKLREQIGQEDLSSSLSHGAGSGFEVVGKCWCDKGGGFFSLSFFVSPKNKKNNQFIHI